MDEDLGKEGREVQKRLRWVAYEERRKGKRAEVGSGGIWIEGRWYRWDEEEEKLKEDWKKKSEGEEEGEMKEEGGEEGGRGGGGRGVEQGRRKEREAD